MPQIDQAIHAAGCSTTQIDNEYTFPVTSKERNKLRGQKVYATIWPKGRFISECQVELIRLASQLNGDDVDRT
uniref:Uncharacterized protein n=1 Tax=Oryza glumipatula TaxID=40148 RepID=A0A0E0B849_9ORYZ